MTLSCQTRCDILTKNGMTKLKVLAAFGLLAGLITTASRKPVRDLLTSTLESLESVPPTESIAILFMLYAVANAPTMLPTNALHVTCGVLFGLYKGSAVALACYTATACLPYIGVRVCFRERAHTWLSGTKYYALIDVINERPLFMLLCTRCSPVVPGSLNNLLFGLCEIGPCTYLAGSALGIAPQLVLFVYCGTLVGDLSRLDDAVTNASGEKMALLAFGGVVTVVMLVWVGVKANKIVKNKLDVDKGVVPHDQLVEVITE